MPARAPRPCAKAGCRATVTTGSRCTVHAAALEQDLRDRDRSRGTAASRGYDRRWRQARALYLAEHPLCALCMGEGATTRAEVVDHKRPHRGDQALFWDVGNWQALCKRHHDAKTSREDGGFGNTPRQP